MVSPPATGSEHCWCCDGLDDPSLMVRLGNHPEVALCRTCARWAAKRADEIDDRDRRGPAVTVRNGVRRVRRTVVDRGWHRHPIVGGPLRQLGKLLS